MGLVFPHSFRILSVVVPRARWTPYLGTFLICFSLLAFEISTVRTISFTVGQSFIYVAIAIAMLGLTAAGSILSLVDLTTVPVRRSVVLFWGCIAIAVLLVASQFLVAASKAELNQAVEAAGRAGGLKAMLPVLMFDGFDAALKIGLFLCLPYFLFGGLLSYLFVTAESTEHGRLYASDLIGAAAGCIGAVIVMEAASYAFSVTAPAFIAALAAAAYVAADSRRLAAAGLIAAISLTAAPLLPAYQRNIEPAADPHFLVRDYDYKQDVVEIWHQWNSYSRVGAVEHLSSNPAYVTLSLDNGAGMARLWPYEQDRPRPYLHPPAIPAMLLGSAKDMLVLFAGAGADMMSARENGFERTVGVELNHSIVNAAKALDKYRFLDFETDMNVSLNLAEGRGYLERDTSRYDVILMSWSGATAVYHLGALSGTTQYLFTFEGLSSILDHLKPEGHAVVLQANKVKILAALRRYLDERNIAEASRTAIILFGRGNVQEWDRAYDDNPLLIKPSGWSEEEVATIVENARDHGYQVAYAPGYPPHPDYTVYSRIATASDFEDQLALLAGETNLRFDVITDDRPFYLDLFDNSRYFSTDFWLGLSRGSFRNSGEVYHFFRIVMVMLIGAIAFGLAIGPLMFGTRLISRPRAASYLGYFLSLGAGFMFLEIGVLQRGSLLFGDPSLTISLVLGSIILFTGIGSLISNWSFRHGASLRLIAIMVVGYIALLAFVMDTVFSPIMTWSMVAKATVLAAIVAPGAILMGHLFPQGLALARREDLSLVPWAWAANGAMSAFVGGLAPLVAQAAGFQTLFLIAALLYAVVIVLPIGPTTDRVRLAYA